MQNKQNSALKWLTWCMLILVCGYSLCYNIIGVTMNPLIDEFQLTGASQGLMNSMMNLGSMLPLLLMPLLQGRIPKIWLIIVTSVLQVVMLALTGVASGFGLLLFACAMLGASNTFTDSCVNSYIVDLHPANSARYLNLIHGFFGLGGLVTPLLITWILETSGWRSAYFIGTAIFGVFCIGFSLIGLRKYRELGTVQASKEAPITAAMLRSYFSNKRNLLLLGAAVFYGAHQLGMVNWIVRYMTLRFDAEKLGSVCMSTYWVTMAICRLFNHKLPFSPKKMLSVGALLAGAAHVIGVLSGSAVGMLAATVVVGLVSGQCIPLMVSEAARGNEDKTSLTTAAIFLLMALARMVMPLVMGAVSDSVSIAAAMMMPAAAALVCGVLCAMANRCRE